ncbi:MAG: DUF2318 domain-containing protein [Peptostreptococcaceae bacterium]|nr:DUF2318 domain-containing protein [Peptostreptococcaceae bacterium]
MKSKENKKKNLLIIAIAIVVVAVAGFSIFGPKNEEQISVKQVSATNENGDIEIPIADITEIATFYAYTELDSKMEVLAVKASDGTIRTAFNTCQVCYSSGRGYYIQEGDVLVCQNCGNRFSMDEVEVTKGGCNPVPIFEEQKEVNGDTITITKEFLKEAEVIFKNWKV